MISFEKWTKDNSFRIEEAISDEGLRFLNTLCTQYNTTITPTQLILGSRVNLGKAKDTKDKDLAYYYATLDRTSKDMPKLVVTFFVWQAGGTSHVWSSQKENIAWDMYQREATGNINHESPPKEYPVFNKKSSDRVRNIETTQKKKQNVENERKWFGSMANLAGLGEDGYFKTKNIAHLVNKQIRFAQDKFGKFAAIPLVDARDNQFVGLQKFYTQTVYDKDGDPIGNKKFTWGLGGENLKHACHVIGKINTKGLVEVCEGYSDGLILHAATGKPVIVCLTAGNIKNVTTAFKKRYPSLKLRFCADNDNKKYDHADNTGVIACYYAAKENGGRIAIPDEPHKDFCDMYNAEDKEKVVLKRIKTILNTSKKVPSKFQWALSVFNLTGLRIKHKDPLLELKKKIDFAVWMASVQSPYTPISKLIPLINASISSLKERIPQITDEQISQLGQYTNTKLEKTRDALLLAAKQPISEVTLKGTNHNYHTITDYKNTDIAQEIIDAESGVFGVQSTHGTGKTSVIAKGCLETALKNDQKVLYICHRTSLTRDASTVLNIYNYQDIRFEDQLKDKNSLSICVNSLINSKYSSLVNKADLVIIDETSQVYRHVAWGSVKDDLRALTYKKLQAVIGNAKKVLAMDADLDDLTIEQLKLARPENEILNVSINQHRHGTKQKLRLHIDESKTVQKIKDGLDTGTKTFFMSDNKKKVNQLGLMGEQDGYRCAYITSDNTKDFGNQSLIKDINGSLKKLSLDMFGGSPTLSSGFSITYPYFEKHYGLYYGQLTPKDFWQQMRRDRTAKVYDIYISAKQQRYETDPAVIKRELDAANTHQRKLLKLGEQTDYVHTDFDNLRVNCLVSDNLARNDYANQFLRLAELDGIEIEYVEDNWDEESSKLLADIKSVALQKEIKDIVNPSMIIDDQRAERLIKSNDRTSDETYQLVNWMIRDRFVLDEVTEDDVNFWDDGKGWKQMKMLELATTPKEIIYQFDKEQQENTDIANSVHQFAALKRGFVKYVLDFVGAKIENGRVNLDDVEFTMAKAVETGFMASLLKHKDSFNACRLGIRLTEKTRAGSVIVAVLNNMGIYTESRRARIKGELHHVHTVNFERTRYALNTLKRRQQADKNYFTENINLQELEKQKEEKRKDQIQDKILNWFKKKQNGWYKIVEIARQLELDVELVIREIVKLAGLKLISITQLDDCQDGIEPDWGKVKLEVPL